MKGEDSCSSEVPDISFSEIQRRPSMDPNDDTVRSYSELVKKDAEFNASSSSGDEVVIASTTSNNNVGGSRTREFARAATNMAKREYKLKLFVLFLLLIIIVGVSVIFHFYHSQQHLIKLGQRIRFDEASRVLSVENYKKETVLVGKLGLNLRSHHLPFHCPSNEDPLTERCLEWKRHASLKIDYFREGKTNCYHIAWEPEDASFLPKDCFDIGKAHWYGGSVSNRQQWPINGHFPKQAFVSGLVYGNSSFGPVIERYWLSSAGVAILVDPDLPLHVSFNASSESNGTVGDGMLCLHSDFLSSPYRNTKGVLPSLNYSICVNENMKDVHKYVMGNEVERGEKVGKSSDDADFSFMQYPVWSTYPVLGSNFTQFSLQSYGNSIQDAGYVPQAKSSVFIIDEQWESEYGDLEFDLNRFPTPKVMLDHLRHKQFEVGLSVHPFVSTFSKSYKSLATSGNLVVDSGNMAPGLAPRYIGSKAEGKLQGYVAMMDMSTEAQQIMKKKIDVLNQEYDINIFRFIGGEVDSLPYHGHFKEAYDNPNDYTMKFNAFASMFGNRVQVQSCAHGQSLGLFLHLHGHNATWSAETNGLRSVIPAVLTAGLLGYPFIIPGVIGGEVNFETASMELYVRWMQLAAFLPVMHFSALPSKYNSPDVDALAHRLMQTHENIVFPRIEKCSKEALFNNTPIIRPVWWLQPDSKEAQVVPDEFIVCNDLLVAPVVTEGQRNRNIFVPHGRWVNGVTQDIWFGPQWIANQRVDLYEIHYFILQGTNPF